MCNALRVAHGGIGYLIWNAWQILAVDTMYVALMVIAMLAFLFNMILEAVEHAVVPWRNRHV
jgi:NitT/TauT family transport system permease protein